MEDHEGLVPTTRTPTPWNRGKLIGAKPPLRPKHVWSIRAKLHMDGRLRDLAMFNVAIDSKLRGCDVVALMVQDIAPNGYAVERAPVQQKKTEELEKRNPCRPGRPMAHRGRAQDCQTVRCRSQHRAENQSPFRRRKRRPRITTKTRRQRT